MGMILTEEQTLLRDSAREFFKEKAPVTALRKLRDTGDATGYSPELWNDMVEMGWSGLPLLYSIWQIARPRSRRSELRCRTMS